MTEAVDVELWDPEQLSVVPAMILLQGMILIGSVSQKFGGRVKESFSCPLNHDNHVTRLSNYTDKDVRDLPSIMCLCRQGYTPMKRPFRTCPVINITGNTLV